MYRVLIVDDEKMIRVGIQKSLDWEYLKVREVYTAASANQAIRILETNQIDLMITDIRMTEKTGLELVKQIRQYETDMRIIVLTGFDYFEYARQALQLQVHDFLLKPIDENELTESIKKQLHELESIQSARNETITEKRTEGLQQQYILEQYMRNLITGKMNSLEKTKAFCEQFHLELSREMRVGILIPQLFAKNDREDEDFRLHTVKNISMDVIDKQNSGLTFSDDDNRIIVVFYCEKNSNRKGEEKIKQLSNILESKFKLKPRMFLGCNVKGFQNLHISYHDAKIMIDKEQNLIKEITKSNNKKRIDIFQDVFREFKKEMLSNMNNKEQLLHILEYFKTTVTSYNLSIKYTRNCYFELFSTVYCAYFDDTGDVPDDSLSTFLAALNSVDRKGAGEMAEIYFLKLLENSNQDEHELIRKAKKIINKNLEKDLTVASIAVELFVTPNYFSRLFKRLQGEGCKNYIVRKRMEKAKTLLESTPLNIGEISTTIGYHDVNYFSLVFKKQTGVTPSDYRKLLDKV